MEIKVRMARIIATVSFIFLGLTFSHVFGHEGHEHVIPYLPPGAKVARVSLPAGQDPSPERLPKEKGKVTVAFFFRMEEGLRLNLKAFLTDPQDPERLWEQRMIPAAEVATANLPIQGSLETGTGLITGPLTLEPARAMRLITLVVDNREGKEEQQFYLPAPNPNVDFLLSSDTDPSVLLQIVPMCLCASSVYTVPKGGLWYRVIALYIAPGAPTPSRASFIMTMMKAPRAAAH